MAEFRQWVAEHLGELVAELHEQGYLVLRGALRPEQIEPLRRGVLAAFEEPDDAYGPLIRVQMFERGEIFEALIDQPGVIDFVEAILGGECHLCAMAAAKTSPGRTIAEWHVDDAVRFPLPEGVKLPPEIRMPCTSLNMIYYLVDVPKELGPTQFVPKSHRSAREPHPYDPAPSYEGNTPVWAVGKAGDVVVYHHQVWHRGGPNTLGERLTVHLSYGCRFIAQRFFPFINYHMPEEILARSDPRRRRLLGIHPRGDD
jgi:ectoine hydroxylase-related dioxygenase (phytanoyl-CoA dioxygenase family)